MWHYNYNVGHEDFLEHADRKHKYVKKERRPTYVRYYYDKDVPATSPDMDSMANRGGSIQYQKDRQDLAYERDHAAGRDDRTWDQHMSDKTAAYRQAQSTKESQAQSGKETREAKQLTEEEEKEQRRRSAVSAGRKLFDYYF